MERVLDSLPDSDKLSSGNHHKRDYVIPMEWLNLPQGWGMRGETGRK